MNGRRQIEPARIRADIDHIEKTSKAIQAALWIIAGGSLVWTATTVTHLATSHGVPVRIAWILSPLVECALIAVLLGDGVLSAYGEPASKWAIGLRWFAGTSSWLMNVWDSLGFHALRHRFMSPDAPGLLIHSIVPALLILLAEVAPRYRRQFAVISERLQDQLRAIEQAGADPVHVTARATRQETPRVTPPAVAGGAGDATASAPLARAIPAPPADASGRKRPAPAAKQTRTDEELIEVLHVLVAEHYREHPGEEIKVAPTAKQLGISRDRTRVLLERMSVRQIPRREAAG